MLLFACKKDNGNIVYSQRPASKNLFLSISGTGNINRTQKIAVLSTASGSASVGLNLTMASSSDITATIGVDTSKLKTYNIANNTQFYLLPASSYALQVPAGGLTIKAGSLFSADSVKINFRNLAGLRASNYLLPVSIMNVSGNNAAILSDSVKTVYLNVNLTDVKQPTVSIATTDGTTKSLTYPVGATGAATVTPVTVKVSSVSPDNITVNTVVDNALVAAYGGGYTPFPDGSYTLSSASSVINSGQLTASAAINISIPDLSKFDGTKVYLLPVSINKVSGDDYALTGNKTVYLKLNFNNLNNGSNTSASGKNILARQNWNVTATSALDGTPYGGSPYPASNAIDSNNATDWVADYTSGGTSSITLDMGSSHNIKTISYNKAYSNILSLFGLNSYPPYVNVSTSTDGVNWTSQGQFKPIDDYGGSTSNPVINYINFYNAISARYVRLEVPYYTGFSEVNVYQ
jgi:hypothetical protein